MRKAPGPKRPETHTASLTRSEAEQEKLHFRFRQNATNRHVSDLSSQRGITVTDSQGFSPYSMRRLRGCGWRTIQFVMNLT